jgi:ubiquinone/menaquinone biosynthesis C-methylase UbiE
MKTAFYTKLAKHYDKIYHYVDYDKQLRLFTRLLKKHDKSGSKRILDVACGTGTHAGLLQKKGFGVVGVDLSKDMLKEARKKNSKVRFIHGDMRKLKIKGKFGTVLCFFNSILFNKNKKEMKKALLNFYNHLEEGGLLIFDVTDKSAGINDKKITHVYKDKKLKITFAPQWVLDPKKKALHCTIDFTVNGKKFRDDDMMGAFSFKEMKQLLKETGFKVLETIKSDKKKAVFVCRK